MMVILRTFQQCNYAPYVIVNTLRWLWGSPSLRLYLVSHKSEVTFSVEGTWWSVFRGHPVGGSVMSEGSTTGEKTRGDESFLLARSITQMYRSTRNSTTCACVRKWVSSMHRLAKPAMTAASACCHGCSCYKESIVETTSGPNLLKRPAKSLLWQ